MKKVLVTTDFSKNYKAGIRFAIQLASQTPCELIFYHVDDRSDLEVWTDTQYTPAQSTRNADQQIELRKFVHSVYKQMGKPILEVSFVVNNKPKAVVSIINYAKKIDADFICMSTRGGGNVEKFLGNNAEKLIMTSPVPIFIVPHAYRSKIIESFLYASDLKKAETELKLVKTIADELEATLSICHDETVMDTAAVKKLLELIYDGAGKEKKLLTRFRKFFAEHSLLHHIKRDVKRLRPSVLVMFTKQNRNWFDRLFNSSKTAEMGLYTKTPMLVFRKTD